MEKNIHVDTKDTITVVVSRRIKKGMEKEFENLSDELTSAAANFKGYLGAVMFRPSSSEDPEYRTVYKFDNQEDLDLWLDSDTRIELLNKIASLLEEKSNISKTSGIVTWLTLPGKKAVHAPAKYKITLVSWFALYPTVTLIFFLFGEQLATIPLLGRTFIVTAIVMPTMAYVLMPRFTKLFSFWLFPKQSKDIR